MQAEIEYMIIKAIYKHYGRQSTEQSCQIVQIVRELQPDIPEDEITGFLAYNVPNKDRMKMKTGRFLTRKLNLNNNFLHDTEIQQLASEINELLFPGMTTVRLDTGTDITDNYRNGIGGYSCMTGDCAEYTGLYASNPDRFQQATIKQNGDSARTIVHKLDNGQYFMDRIYSTCEYLRRRLRDYAEQQGWELRENDNINCSIPFDMTVSGLEWTDGEIPYMDSLTGYRIENRLLTITSGSDCDGTLNSQHGCIENSIMCYNCDTTVEDDFVYPENDCDYCESCHSELFGYCEQCENTCAREDMIHIQDEDIHVCDYCASNNYQHCEDCNDYFKDAIEINGNYYCESCVEKYPICENCSKTVLKTNDYVFSRGYCENCTSDHEDEVPCNAETGQLFKEETC